jgi:hypothetical protein
MMTREYVGLSFRNRKEGERVMHFCANWLSVQKRRKMTRLGRKAHHELSHSLIEIL